MVIWAPELPVLVMIQLSNQFFMTFEVTPKKPSSHSISARTAGCGFLGHPGQARWRTDGNMWRSQIRNETNHHDFGYEIHVDKLLLRISRF
jgi:hypothetical protein